MRYPNLPLINVAAEESRLIDRAWAGLGQDLATTVGTLATIADEAVQNQDHTAELVARLGLAEGVRRRYADHRSADLGDEALQLAVDLGDRGLLVAAGLVYATILWDLGRLDAADAVLDTTEPLLIDGLERACARLARARVARYRSDLRRARLLASDALGMLSGLDEPDAVADAHRELAAVDLMTDEHASARLRAELALEHHRRTGDQFRVGQSLVLLARSYGSARSEEQLAAFERANLEAEVVGSPSLEATVRIHLAQHLQAGATPDSPRWHQAYGHAERARQLSTDELALAELAVTTASLELTRYDPDGVVDDLLQDALAGYERLGNQAGVASVSKVKGRLGLQRALQARGAQRARHVAEALAAYALATRSYLDVGMIRTSRRLGAEVLLASKVATGHGPTVAEARALVSSIHPADLHARARALLVLTDALLEQRPRRRGRGEVADLLLEARRLADETDDRLIRAAVDFGDAELAVAENREQDAAERLRLGLEVLSAIDGAVIGGPGRARFVDTIEPITRRALRTAVAIGDARSGLHLLEVRRSGRLAGLLRRRGGVTIDPSIADLLARLERRRAVEGGVYRGWGEVAPDPPEAAGPELSLAELREELGELTSAAFAEVYDPDPIDIDALLDAVPPHVDLLILEVPDPAEPAELVIAAVSGPTRELEVTGRRLPDSMVDLLGLLASDDDGRDPARASLRPRDLTPLTPLFPRLLRERLSNITDGDLLIVPSGLTWSIPWAGIPIEGTRLLVDAASLTIAPSLRVHALVGASGSMPITGEVATWRGRVGSSPTLAELTIFEERGLPTARPATRGELLAFLHQGSRRGAVALACHGDAQPGLAHGLELDRDVWLRAHDLLGGDLPRFLFLGACHSAFAAGDVPTEPIGLPTVALCSGTMSLIAASTRIPDSTGVSALLGSIYARIIDGEHPARAVRQELLAVPDRETGMLAGWAPLVAVGSAPSQPPA